MCKFNKLFVMKMCKYVSYIRYKNVCFAVFCFFIYTNDGVIPLEVKAGDTTKSKSLNTFIEKYNPKYSIRISTKNFGYENNIKSVPLYAAFCINE